MDGRVTQLHIHSQNLNLEGLQWLDGKAKISINEVNARSEGGLTPLMCAGKLYRGIKKKLVKKNLLGVVNFLLEKGANVHMVDDDGNTIFHHLAYAVRFTGTSKPLRRVFYTLTKFNINMGYLNNDGDTAFERAFKVGATKLGLDMQLWHSKKSKELGINPSKTHQIISTQGRICEKHKSHEDCVECLICAETYLKPNFIACQVCTGFCCELCHKELIQRKLPCPFCRKGFKDTSMQPLAVS